MKAKLKRMLPVVLVAACSLLHADEESVLWWMFDEATDIYAIDGTSSWKVDELTGRGASEGLAVNGIRVAAYQGDSLLGYLALADADNASMDFYPMPTTDFDSGTASWNAGPTYARVAPFASTPGVTFMIELGNWDAMRASDAAWQVLAHSDAATMDALADFLDVGDFEMHTKLEWTGGHYSVPEPSGGLLLLIGGALLSLRRGRASGTRQFKTKADSGNE